MEVPFVDLRAQYDSISPEINAAIEATLKRGDFVLGEEVRSFEGDFCRFVGAAYGVGVGSGLAAIELALRAYGIGLGDEVITAANTFIATVLAILAVGAKPILVDMDPVTYNIDPRALEAAITSRTRAIVPVHLYGQPAEVRAILAVASKHNLIVIEDAAQSHGAAIDGRRTGSWGHAAAFSFYPAKNLGAYGDGGMVVSSDAAVVEKIRRLRNYGQSVKYKHTDIGTNSRLDTVQAAILRVKLRHLDRWNAARRDHAAAYSSLLADSPCLLPGVAPNRTHVFHLYVVQVENRDGVQDFLRSRGVSTGVHYPIPAHLQEACASLGYRRGDFPAAEDAASRILSLPMYAEITAEQQEYVARNLQQALDVSARVSPLAAP